MQSHLAEASQHGRRPAEALRALGSPLRLCEQSGNFRVLAWLDSLRADTVLAWRQLRKNAAVSAAALLSLAPAMGACTCAFRIIDALLLCPLPVNDPANLFVLTYPFRDGTGKTAQQQ